MSVMRYIKILFTTLTVIGLVVFTAVSWHIAFAATTDKTDGDCNPQAIISRCADKCPDGSHEIGTNDNGAAICKANPTGCPYGENLPIGPECDKANPNQPPPMVEGEQFVGK